jgi:hypothetical protein
MDWIILIKGEVFDFRGDSVIGFYKNGRERFL